MVTGIDRLGRNIVEVMQTVNELADKQIALRSLRESIDSTIQTQLKVRHPRR